MKHSRVEWVYFSVDLLTGKSECWEGEQDENEEIERKQKRKKKERKKERKKEKRERMKKRKKERKKDRKEERKKWQTNKNVGISLL